MAYESSWDRPFAKDEPFCRRGARQLPEKQQNVTDNDNGYSEHAAVVVQNLPICILFLFVTYDYQIQHLCARFSALRMLS